MERVTATISFDDKKITLEGPEDFVRRELDRFTKPPVVPAQENATETIQSERALIEEKQPTGHHEIVAVLAFYLMEQGSAEFTPEEMRRAYIRAGIKPPKVVAQALRDAKRHHDFVEAGTVRGTFKLSHHGERVVRFELPRKSKE